jgi:uncharacterized protein YyaL (SSP411 family)
MLDPLPGAPPRPADLDRRLAEAATARAPSDPPRTHHLRGGAPRFTNRLVLERSPYLRQHAHNPVDWRPWGPEAFAEAAARGVPVFLSVGYSTCHWCHVMEEESFEDETIAGVLNGRYVPVKVDREERPDVDQLYMTAVQLLTGRGGWPMSVWLTPAGEPFFGGTYFPPRDGARGGQRGFLSILEEISAVHGGEPEKVAQATASLTAAVRSALGPAGPPGDQLPGLAVVDGAVERWLRQLDPVHGGVRGAPKFPSSMPVRLLLRHHRRTGDPRSLRAATLTLDGLAGGGIHDQLGGGFHRYATDDHWLVPHFEKMLYDNALLVLAFVEGWQVTGSESWARVARDTAEMLLRDFAAPDGGFASASDADSEGEEGRSFTWSAAEIDGLLGADSGRFKAFHGVSAEGNWEGANVLHAPRPDEAEWRALAGPRRTLLEARGRRIQPLRDDKVLAGWNGLAIEALAFAGRVLDEPRWIEAAARAAGFLLDHLVVEGRLRRGWLAGPSATPGFLDDHAFLAAGLLELFAATAEPRWLTAAVTLAEAMERRFADPARGGWFQSADDHERLLVREKEAHDGAEPAGSSVAVQALLRLAAFTGDQRWRAAAERALRDEGPALQAAPMARSDLLLGLELAHAPERLVVLAWPDGSPPPAELLGVLRRAPLAGAALLCGPASAVALASRVAPAARDRAPADGRATAFVCEGQTCRLPAFDPGSLERQLAATPRQADPGGA